MWKCTAGITAWLPCVFTLQCSVKIVTFNDPPSSGLFLDTVTCLDVSSSTVSDDSESQSFIYLSILI